MTDCVRDRSFQGRPAQGPALTGGLSADKNAQIWGHRRPGRWAAKLSAGLAGSQGLRGQALFPVYDTRRTPLMVLWYQVRPREACLFSVRGLFISELGKGRPAVQRPRT